MPRGLSALSGRYSVFRLFFYCLAADWRYLRIQTVAAAAFCVHMPACQRISDTDLEPPGLYVLFPVMPVPYPCIQQACGNDSNYNDSLQFFHGISLLISCTDFPHIISYSYSTVTYILMYQHCLSFSQYINQLRQCQQTLNVYPCKPGCLSPYFCH